ncbi:MAG TPA: hypothetical protein ACYCC7_01280 [Candidatus Azoamicus sp. MARI]
MLSENEIFSKSKTYKYFEKEVLNDKIKRDMLVSFEELLNIKKNIKNIYNTDDPNEIKTLIGEKKNNVLVTEKDYNYALLIEEKYKMMYEKCKEILDEMNKK